MNKIIAVVGMCGSGKSVVSDILENMGWHAVYFGGLTYKKMQEEGIEITYDSQKTFREELRKLHGEDCYAKMLLPEIRASLEEGNVVLDGLYSWYEYKYLKEIFGDNLILVCIISDKNIRYDRISKRVVRPFNKENAIKRDVSEIESLYKGGPIAYSDYFILNNGEVSVIVERVHDILKKIENKE